MVVDIDELFELKKKLWEINQEDLSDIVWMRNGQVLKFDESDLQDWRFTGLSNTSFPEFYVDEE
jgi:hypothetical protein